MQRRLSIITLGLSVSAMFAILYVVLILGSMLLVGFLTTGSWQAFFLGIDWYTIAGFEVGFLGVGIVGFSIALVVVLISNTLKRFAAGNLENLAQENQSGGLTSRSWRVRLLIASLVLPALSLLALRALALAAKPGNVEAAIPGSGSQMRPVTMSSVINTARREAEPSFTGDGRTMYFNCYNGDICVSHLIGTWEEGNWTPPERLGAPISTEFEDIEPVINSAGDKLYFTSYRPVGSLKGLPFLSSSMSFFRLVNTLAAARLGRSFFGGLGFGNIFVSYLKDGAWSEPQNINDIAGEPHVNTEFADHCLFFSNDGNEAFWTSTRPGGFGDDDIWTSRRVDGNWTQPENLGSNVNGPGSEHSPIPTPDGQSLYITTTRPEGFGKEDIYITTRGADGSWGPLSNLGPAVNGPGDDRCPAWTPDLKVFLFDSVRDGGFGGRDIWWIYYKDIKGYPITATSPSLHQISNNVTASVH